MTKVTIVTKRPFEFTGKDGNQVTGNMYGCFDENGKSYEFSSSAEHEVQEGETAFNPVKCKDIPVETVFFAGKVKFREKRA
jgi:hypothetical protein